MRMLYAFYFMFQTSDDMENSIAVENLPWPKAKKTTKKHIKSCDEKKME